MSSKLETANQVIRECFWGDYTLTAQDILDRLDSKDPAFEAFIFSKVIENSSFPSGHLAILLDRDRLVTLMSTYLRRNSKRKRIRLVAANILGKPDLVPEHAWAI